jgi:hypothetical protein
LNLGTLKNPEYKVVIPGTLCKAQWLAVLATTGMRGKGHPRHRFQNAKCREVRLNRFRGPQGIFSREL